MNHPRKIVYHSDVYKKNSFFKYKFGLKDLILGVSGKNANYDKVLGIYTQ